MDKELLFEPQDDDEFEHDVPGLGVVRFRSLTRKETLAIRAKAQPLDAFERKVLARAMLDPAMTEAEVGRWQESKHAGEIEAIMEKIAANSGMVADADKQAYQSFRGEPRT